MMMINNQVDYVQASVLVTLCEVKPAVFRSFSLLLAVSASTLSNARNEGVSNDE